MAGASIEAQVVELVAEHGEVQIAKVLPTTRILDDLGIDADDAVELFQAIRDRFGTDLTHLDERWDDHFGPEGLGCGAAALLFGPALLIGMPVAIITNIWVGFLVATLSVIASFWIVPHLGLGKDMKPITVAQIVRAVESESWRP
jgi:acyl carrier protein